MQDAVTHTIDVPGATLTYDVRGELAERDQPVLVLIGSPMGASGFPTLASYFTDRTVVTYDPRGVERSVRTDGGGDVSPDVHATDLATLIETLDAGPVDLFATSGGAVNALALTAKRPDLIHTLVAHEPPLASILPDSETALAACADVCETYQRDGLGAGMAKFIALVGFEGQIQPTTASSRTRIRRCSACPPRTTAPATTLSLPRLSARSPRTNPTSTPSARPKTASSWPSARNPPSNWPAAAAQQLPPV
jgi:pimeloyl-ACP methyl ester carboxylesterase